MYLGHDKVSGSFGDTYPLGVISDFAGLQIPYGWLLCDGRELSRTEYAPLFEVIGTTYGEGDGETTFNIPNIKGRVTVAVDESQEEFAELGKLGGSKFMQEHDHYVKDAGYDGGSSGDLLNFHAKQVQVTAYMKTGTAGTGDSENLQPYIVVNKIIKASNVLYVLDRKDALVVDNLEDNSSTNAPSQRAVNEALELNAPVTLYTSKSGTFDPITLTEEAENFEYVEVFGVGNTMICSVKIPMKLYNTGSLFTAGASYQYQCGVSFTGKNMTFIYNRRLNISSNAWDNGNYFKIYRIIGYR